MLNDLRYACRLMRRYPGFTAVAILLLGVATGTATGVFAVGDALLLRKLPLSHPEELVSSHGGSYVLLKKIRGLDDVLTDAGGICLLDRFNVTIGDSNVDPGPVRVALVTGNYLPLLGVHASIGRTLTPEDDRTPGAHPVAVISDRYWRLRFGAATAIVGRTLILNGTTYSIIGVMPPSFTGDTIARPVDIWMPTMMQSQVMTEMPGLLMRTNGWLRIVARLRPGVSVAQGRIAMQTVYTRDQIDAAGPGASPQLLQSIQRERFELVSIASGYLRDRDSVLLSVEIVGGVACLLLVIACANVANLMLARAETRQREMAIRLAIGGGYGRLFRQLLIESVVLSLTGGAVGLLLAVWATDALSATVFFGPTQMDPRAPSAWMSFDVGLGWAGLLFSLLVCIGAGVVSGLAAAVRGARTTLSPVLTGFGAGGGRGPGRLQIGDALIVAQVALSLMLVIDAALFVRSVSNVKALDLGVDRGRLLLVWANPGQTIPVNALVETTRTIRERITAVAGVSAASMSNHGLLEGNEGGGSSDLIIVDGRPAPPGLQIYRDAVTPGFFSTARAPILSGREFADRDGADAPHVIVINQVMSHFLFGDADAVGRRITLPGDRTPVEIIGVVGNIRHGTPRDSRGVWYVAAAQYPGLMRTMCIVIRTSVEPAAVAGTVRRVLNATYPTLPILRIDTLAEQLDDLLVQERLVAGFSTIFGALAACIAGLGLYGIVWYMMSRRKREIGIRLALGATRATIIRRAVRDALLRTAIGITIAVPLAITFARLASSRLYGIGSADPMTIGGSALATALVATFAAIVPARAASHVNPVVTC